MSITPLNHTSSLFIHRYVSTLILSVHNQCTGVLFQLVTNPDNLCLAASEYNDGGLINLP